MPFFDQVDALGIVENHIGDVLRLEHDQSQTILEFYGGERDRLLKRLMQLPPGTFTRQHLLGTLAQVQGAISAINEKLGGTMLDGAYESAMMSVGDLTSELETFDNEFLGAVTPINLDAALVAHDTTKFLVTKYKTNLDAYGSDLMAQIADGLFSASLGETGHEDVVRRIGHFFTAEEWKLRRIVRTELHNIYNIGKINGMQALASEQVPDLMKALMHPMDQRTGADSKYAARQNLVAAIDEPFEYMWKGKLRVFLAPPDRPNDRAILIPYRKEWGKAVGGAFVPGEYPLAS